MVAVSDFSGLASSACALANAPAMVPIDSLDRCMVCLLLAQDVEAHGSGFRAPGPDTVSGGLLGVLWHQALQLGLGALVIQKGRPGPAEHPGKLGPGVGRTHIDRANGRDERPRRLDPENARGLAALDAAPELLLGGEQEMLVERIRRYRDLDPFAAPGDD